MNAFGNDIHLFSVLDGHGTNGDKVSELVKMIMRSVIEDELLRVKQKSVFLNSDFGGC